MHTLYMLSVAYITCYNIDTHAAFGTGLVDV